MRAKSAKLIGEQTRWQPVITRISALTRQSVMLAGLILCSNEAGAQAQFSFAPRSGQDKGPGVLFGVWGNASQCDAYRKGAFGNPALFPYEIDNRWIRQGSIYCYLSWIAQDSDGDGLVVHANAQCGEDDLRDYRLLIRLRDEKLRIRWSEDFTTAELRTCRR